jgi:DNA-directed RNA polymerase subunit RPC12/RpoP
MKKETLLPFEKLIIKKKQKTRDGKVLYKNTCAYCGDVVDYIHGMKPEVCPYCNSEDYIKPVTETRLFLLQKEFFKHKNKEVLGSMYLIMVEYAESLVKKTLPDTFKRHFNKVKEKATDAVNLVISYYLEKPGFKIEKSFAGYLKTKIKQVLWNKKLQNEENHESIYGVINENIDKEILQLPDVLGFETLFPHYSDYRQREHDKEELIKGLENVIETISNTIGIEYNSYYKLLTLIGIFQYITNQGQLEKFYATFGALDLKELINKSMVIVYEFLKDH